MLTGANGFVGKNLYSALKQKFGAEKILTPTSTELNLWSEDSIKKYFTEHKIDLVIHLAAKFGDLGNYTSKQLFYFEKNLTLNFNIVKQAIESGVKKFITVGSAWCYNSNLKSPITENEIFNGFPENAFGFCKNSMLTHLQAQSQMNWTYLLLPNPYGPNDHFKSKFAHLIPATIDKFINAKLNGEKEIIAYGDGSPIRDFLYVDDLTDVLIDSIDNHLYDRLPINLSTATGTTVKYVVEKIQSLLNMNDIKIKWNPQMADGIQEKVLDNKRLLSIRPNHKFISIDEGLKRTVEWYRKLGGGVFEKLILCSLLILILTKNRKCPLNCKFKHN